MVWQEVIKDSNVWVYEYVANGYKANTFAIMLDGNNLAMISPPTGLSETDFAAIDAKGQVVALIAPGTQNLRSRSQRRHYKSLSANETVPLFAQLEGKS